MLHALVLGVSLRAYVSCKFLMAFVCVCVTVSVCVCVICVCVCHCLSVAFVCVCVTVSVCDAPSASLTGKPPSMPAYGIKSKKLGLDPDEIEAVANYVLEQVCEWECVWCFQKQKLKKNTETTT